MTFGWFRISAVAKMRIDLDSGQHWISLPPLSFQRTSSPFLCRPRKRKSEFSGLSTAMSQYNPTAVVSLSYNLYASRWRLVLAIPINQWAMLCPISYESTNIWLSNGRIRRTWFRSRVRAFPPLQIYVFIFTKSKVQRWRCSYNDISAHPIFSFGHECMRDGRPFGLLPLRCFYIRERRYCIS